MTDDLLFVTASHVGEAACFGLLMSAVAASIAKMTPLGSGTATDVSTDSLQK